MTATQNDRIIQYMDEFGSITQMQALSDLGIMRLASRIHDLREMGHPIKKRMIESKNRYGEHVSFAEYYMEREEQTHEQL